MPQNPEHKNNLLEDLLDAGTSLPPSHVPVVAELQRVVAGLVLHIEHGDAFLQAIRAEGDDELHRLLGGKDTKAPDLEQPAAGARGYGGSTPAETPNQSTLGLQQAADRPPTGDTANRGSFDTAPNVNPAFSSGGVAPPTEPPERVSDDSSRRRAELVQQQQRLAAELAQLDNPGGGHVEVSTLDQDLPR